MNSSYRNRKIQRVLLNIRLKIKGKPLLKDIEIPNAPRLITAGAKLPPIVLKGDDSWFDYLANGYILWGVIITTAIIGTTLKVVWLKWFIKGICE